MTEKQPTEKQRKRWREQRARLRLMAKHFPPPPKVVLTPEEKREIRNQKERDRRAALAPGAVDLTCPQFLPDGRNLPSMPARKRPKCPEKRASGPWDQECLAPQPRARPSDRHPPR
jgi:hypothetical protein